MYMHMKMGDDVRKISGAIDPAATKWGPPTSLAQPVFLSAKLDIFGNFPTAEFHQIWPRHVNPCDPGNALLRYTVHSALLTKG